MGDNEIPHWLGWGREIQALAQTGLFYAVNDFDRQRYQRLQDIATEIISEHTDLASEFLAGLFNSQTGYATPRVDVRAAVFSRLIELLYGARALGWWVDSARRMGGCRRHPLTRGPSRKFGKKLVCRLRRAG